MPDIPRIPPKFVPTLTEVVQLPEAAAVQSLDFSPTNPASGSQERSSNALDNAITERTELTLRLLQRVDVLLERRIRAAVSNAVALHTAALIGELRPIIEQAVQEAVSDALSQEATGQAPQW